MKIATEQLHCSLLKRSNFVWNREQQQQPQQKQQTFHMQIYVYVRCGSPCVYHSQWSFEQELWEKDEPHVCVFSTFYP